MSSETLNYVKWTGLFHDGCVKSLIVSMLVNVVRTSQPVLYIVIYLLVMFGLDLQIHQRKHMINFGEM